MVRIQNLEKSFDGLLGVNGADKSTTLGMICGVLKPDSGSICVDGLVENVRASQSRLGALLDHTGIYSRLNVRESLMYFGRLRGMARSL
jgi:ABC-type Na+ transport system ATPase subunit NatA